ncbi:MAG: SusD/RagB family nutrient-binding outer membrane lipoprotein [Bacteroidales bacterium]|nr:SusD/RagB family nutrient-binding outer membrane lipoprotein [Bacteroidales bacterium]
MWNSLGWDEGGTQTLSSKATCASDFIINYLSSTNDPRISYIYEEPSSGHLGVPQGLLDYDTPVPDQFILNLMASASSRQATWIESSAHGEGFSDQAELRQKGILTTGPSAQALYESGITASFLFIDFTRRSDLLFTVKDLVNWGNSPTSFGYRYQKWDIFHELTDSLKTNVFAGSGGTEFPERNMPIS